MAAAPHIPGAPSFPLHRPRRLRLKKAVRDLVAETRGPAPEKMILPVFVHEGLKRPRDLRSLPGHKQFPPQSKELIGYLQEAMDLRVKSFLLFGSPVSKDYNATKAWDSEGPVQRALRFIRRELGEEPAIFTDLCMCGYADHGHCGVPRETPRGTIIDNDETLKIYGKIAVSQAEAGADFVAPSGMMDGQVRAIREALDSQGFTYVGIMSYSVKYASAFYGPFRDVMDSAPRFGDRKSYQMDPRNYGEALKEALMDVSEGADIIMVKPALLYLDVIRFLKDNLPWVPLAAYNVSGEYIMVKLAVSQGFLRSDAGPLEVLASIFRAGADIVITYHALEVASLLRGGYTV